MDLKTAVWALSETLWPDTAVVAPDT